MSTEIAVRVLKHIDQLPKRTLVYCKDATLAAAMVLMQVAIRQGETLQAAFQRVEDLGVLERHVQLLPAPSAI